MIGSIGSLYGACHHYMLPPNSSHHRRLPTTGSIVEDSQQLILFMACCLELVLFMAGYIQCFSLRYQETTCP